MNIRYSRTCRVSIATVSRVVNDSPRVSEKTKQRVRAIMEENGYTPNVFARGLGADSMKTIIGIICPDVSDSYMASAAFHLEGRLHEYGYDCILCCAVFEQANKEKYVSLLLNKRIDALILVDRRMPARAETTGRRITCGMRRRRFPVFMINGYIKEKCILCVQR